MTVFLISAGAAAVVLALTALEHLDVLPDRDPLVRSIKAIPVAVIAVVAVLSPNTLLAGVQTWVDHRVESILERLDLPPTSTESLATPSP